MSNKIGFRKSIYDSVGKMPKRTPINMFQGPKLLSTIHRAKREREEGIPSLNLPKSVT